MMGKNISINRSDAVTELHNKGFTDDFQLLGNDLLWVQGKVIIKSTEFSIVASHVISEPGKKMREFVVCGIIAPFHYTKGILLQVRTKNKQKDETKSLVYHRSF